MQVLGMSDVEIGHIQIFVVFPNRGECCWHLEWETKGEADQNTADRPLHYRILEVGSDIAKHECICIFDILYSYPRMYPSCPLSASITIRINENAHFPGTSTWFQKHQHHVHDTALLLCPWQQLLANLVSECYSSSSVTYPFFVHSISLLFLSIVTSAPIITM